MASPDQSDIARSSLDQSTFDQHVADQDRDLSARGLASEAMSARRLLVAGGLSLILAGMIFGDIFAVFVLHQNAGRVGSALEAAALAVQAGDSDAVMAHFAEIGNALENRGTKVDTHVHVIDFGYLALLLALIQPLVAFSEKLKRRFAVLFLIGAVMLPVSVFLIHYVGLKYSPLESIGWASIAADFGGLLVIAACCGEIAGLWRHFRSQPARVSTEPRQTRDWCVQTLLAGGTLLILAGFLHGAWYAAVYLDRHEADDRRLLGEMIGEGRPISSARESATGRTLETGDDQRLTGKPLQSYRALQSHRALQAYGALQAEKAINIAAHSHAIEFGVMSILLAFAQEFVLLASRWKRRWVVVLLSGSAVLPVFVLLEGRFGLLAGGVADAGGLMVIVALGAMLIGVIRHQAVADLEGSTDLADTSE